MIPTTVDTLPAIVLPALILLALAIFMPWVGRRAAKRREAWARFDALIRVRGIPVDQRENLVRWAQVSCPDSPHYVLVRRKDFDRFARSEVQRLQGLPQPVFASQLEALSALRRRLGFERRAGFAQSSHDLAAGERVVLRRDSAQPVTLRVVGVDEQGVHVDAFDPGALKNGHLGKGWATFSRDGEGYYRFRTSLLRTSLLSHGSFLVHEDRRRDPRVPLKVDPFWVAVDRLPDGAAPEDPEGVEVEVVDLSVGGLALLADREVRRGSELWLDLPLANGPGSPRLRNLRARVLGHGYREGGGDRPHFLHCTFVELAEAPRKVLEAFVFERAGRPSG